MRLSELNPRWFAEPWRHGQGVTFECPCCRRIRLAVAFKNPIDGGPPVPHFETTGEDFSRAYAAIWNEREGTIGVDIVPPGYHWNRSGETFETLSLHPSVDASRSGHWHGHIENGLIK
jgi:hypothetical protein